MFPNVPYGGDLNGIKAVVFDAYGTLVEINKKRWPYRMILEALKKRGFDISNEHKTQLMSAPVELMDVSTLFNTTLPPELSTEVLHALREELESITLYPDVVPVFAGLRKAQIKLGLCSNLAKPYAAPVQSLLPHELDAYAWSFEIGAVKPDPLIYMAVCRSLEVEPNEALFIGDTEEADYLGPRAVGMHAMLLDRTGTKVHSQSIHKLTDLLPRA